MILKFYFYSYMVHPSLCDPCVHDERFEAFLEKSSNICIDNNNNNNDDDVRVVPSISFVSSRSFICILSSLRDVLFEP